ncbi:MAG: hypothetical protein IJB96_02185 [Lachnospira sp.]|nr:hypothetical protein [Lachnospira sp.]
MPVRIYFTDPFSLVEKRSSTKFNQPYYVWSVSLSADVFPQSVKHIAPAIAICTSAKKVAPCGVGIMSWGGFYRDCGAC